LPDPNIGKESRIGEILHLCLTQVVIYVNQDDVRNDLAQKKGVCDS
jgi:hypothetical protein